MFEEKLLKSKLMEKGVTTAELCDALDICEATYYRKLARDGDFSRVEIMKIVDMLKLTSIEKENIFFDGLIKAEQREGNKMIEIRPIEFNKKIEEARCEVADVLKNNELCIGEAFMVLEEVKTAISNSYQDRPLKEFL